MKTRTIETVVMVCNYEELSAKHKLLIDKAKEQVNNAYAPYSGFQVGAALLLENGEVFGGNNQENAAYPSGLCAERTTMFYANAQRPSTAVKAIAIAAFTKGSYLANPISPCGACRQALLETETRFNSDIEVLLYGEENIIILPNIKSLLPFCFVKESLNG